VPLLLTEKDVDELSSAPLALRAARETAELVAAGQVVTSRVQVADEMVWTRILVGILPTLNLLGYKQFHRVGQRVRYHVHLFERTTGDHIATVDGRRITSLRTAATAALAVALYAEGSIANHLGIIGSGEEAKEGLRMVSGAVDVSTVSVFSPTPKNREAFAQELGGELGLPVVPVGSVEEALRGADIAYIATSAEGEAFLGFDELRDVRVVAAIGSTRPNQRELKGDAIARTGRVVIDCDDARHEPGDMIDAVENHGFDPASAMLLGSELTAAAGHRGPVLFKSIGSVEQDLVLALHLVRAAADAGRGAVIPEVGSLRIMR
jgi:ornithine cyclodeaminase/alanine dehydrogenase-like protein (mu-crystallin family)